MSFGPVCDTSCATVRAEVFPYLILQRVAFAGHVVYIGYAEELRVVERDYLCEEMHSAQS
jgi:hypothetical protein